MTSCTSCQHRLLQHGERAVHALVHTLCKNVGIWGVELGEWDMDDAVRQQRAEAAVKAEMQASLMAFKAMHVQNAA